MFEDTTGAGDWGPSIRLAAPAAAQDDGRFFGDSVALSGDRLAVAETGTPAIGPNRGEFSRVYIYGLESGSWNLVQQMTNAYVQSVCLEGEWLVLGAKDEAEIYRKNGPLFELVQTVDIAALGTAWPLVQAELQGRRLFISVVGDTTLLPTQAWVLEYRLDDSGRWVYARTFDSQVAGAGVLADGFGRSLSAHGTQLAVGAPRDDEKMLQCGAVYVIDLPSGEMEKVLPPGGFGGMGFGASVLLEDENLYVGSMGSTALYHFYRLAGEWTYVGLFKAEESGPRHFGAAIAKAGDLLLAGSLDASAASPSFEGLARVLRASVDQDTLPDTWETYYFGHPSNAVAGVDSDGDGLSNWEEYWIGSDPIRIESTLALEVPVLNHEGMILNWNAVPGCSYSIQKTASLKQPFTLLEHDIHYPQNRYTDTVSAAESAAFYRIEADRAVLGEVGTHSNSRPNIIFILADDVGVESMTSYGGSSWDTPRIDSIAHQGMRFERAFATPSCAPTRSEFLTGRYPFRTGITFPTLPNGPLSTNEITLATVLQNAGYATGLAGKWNLRYGNRRDADATEQAAHIEAHGFEEHKSFIGHTILYGDPVGETNYVPYQLNQWACDFVKEQAAEPGPFYLQYSLGLVHTRISPTPLNPNDTTSTRSELYGYMMQYMDQMVGRLLDAVDAAGIAENTVLVFAGDNGTYKMITSVFNGVEIEGGKLTYRDVGSWVSFYVRWPGVVQPGSIYDGLTDFSDLFSTLGEVGGASLPDDRVIDGVSFVPQLFGNPREHRDFIYASDRDRRFIRSKQWKLVNETDLYDVSQSPYIERLVDPAQQTPEEGAARALLEDQLEQLKNRTP